MLKRFKSQCPRKSKPGKLKKNRYPSYWAHLLKFSIFWSLQIFTLKHCIQEKLDLDPIHTMFLVQRNIFSYCKAHSNTTLFNCLKNLRFLDAVLTPSLMLLLILVTDRWINRLFFPWVQNYQYVNYGWQCQSTQMITFKS